MPPEVRHWRMRSEDGANRTETLELRDGLTMVLSDIAPGEECSYHFVEPEDVFGIGFHLKGGTRFDMDGTRFATQPLEVHAGAAPRSSGSVFVLPSHGFKTVSLRFSLDAAQDLIERHSLGMTPLAQMIARAGDTVSARRLSSLDPAGVAMVETMFANPYAGAGRSLYLESCAIGLLAGQIDALAGAGKPFPTPAWERGMVEVRAYLDAHLDDPPSIVELARMFGINDFKLKRAFKSSFGTTIFGYVRQRRLERAVGDLNSGLTVAAAAEQAGYECPRCFADAFRRHFGMLPSEMTRSSAVETPARHG
ncbi:helix-turn-helix transcriptional regulator [Novosphingobium sp. ERN07]|uniref:helix-turn-helix transcriptional regulator n=1 Tax=Novosphingobium sp. ERN07 TaxID=2726187 RepID=UPI00145772E7|nr:AraC family transcriptional regulator [Novosphingobium sp. ERN07]NLR73375.1 helix-turn-helix transcriptional regulator [Novosphingobium sp. ERN07]